MRARIQEGGVCIHIQHYDRHEITGVCEEVAFLNNTDELYV